MKLTLPTYKIMGLFKKIIKLLTSASKKPALTQEEQNIVDQVVVIQPIIRNDYKK